MTNDPMHPKKKSSYRYSVAFVPGLSSSLVSAASGHRARRERCSGEEQMPNERW